MKLLIWDFDGTLGYREGGMWSASLCEAVGIPAILVRRPHPDIPRYAADLAAVAAIVESAP